MGCNAKEYVSLLAGFSDPVKVEMLKVSYTTVNNLEMIGRGSLTEISPLYQSNRQTSQRSVPRRRYAKDPPTHYDQVVFFIGQI